MPLVRDALDSLEFISGPADSPWGSLRAAMGHPEPWSIRFMAIGNEVRVQQSTAQHNNAAQHSRVDGWCRLRGAAPYAPACAHALLLQGCGLPWDPPVYKPYYLQNYLAFFGAIKAAYPHMRLIASCDMGQDAPTGGCSGRVGGRRGRCTWALARAGLCKVWVGVACAGMPHHDGEACCVLLIAPHSRLTCPSSSSPFPTLRADLWEYHVSLALLGPCWACWAWRGAQAERAAPLAAAAVRAMSATHPDCAAAQRGAPCVTLRACRLQP